MATFTVTSAADDGGGADLTLREAVERANARDGDDRIVFDLGEGESLIRLKKGEIEITDAVEIDGGGLVTITGDAKGNDFLFDDGVLDNGHITNVPLTRWSAFGIFYNDNTRIFNITERDATTTLKGLTLTGGRAKGPDKYLHESGGAVRSEAHLTLENMTVAGNRADYDGGGVSSQSGNVTVTGSTISLNAAGLTGKGGGGGVHATRDSITTITDSTVSYNSATDSGGGVLGRGDTYLTGSTISGNGAGYDGGGLYSDFTITLSNSTISGNAAANDGGGMYGRLIIRATNSTISGNKAKVSGGGIDGDKQVFLTNSIVLGNDAKFRNDIYTLSGIYSKASHYAYGNIANVFAETAINEIGVHAGVLADNGGPTKTIRILEGGLAHNEGIEVELTTDQRGGRRLLESKVDIGALELGNNPPVAVDDSAETDSDTAVTGLLLTNDSDFEGDDLTVTAVNGQSKAVGEEITLASGALVMVNADGAFEYDPNGAFDNLLRGSTRTDSFEYTISDGRDEASATASITIDGKGGRSPVPGPEPVGGTFGPGDHGGTNGPDLFIGGPGNDDFAGFRGDDTLIGGAGKDTLKGGKGDDRIVGGSGDDLLKGARGNDNLAGRGGDDLLKGGKNNDTLKGGVGDDVARGAKGNDLLKGGGGDDRLFGGTGHDLLNGGAGDDLLGGGAGNDRFIFSGGDDTVRGGGGNDMMVFNGNIRNYDIFEDGGAIHIERGNHTVIAINIETMKFGGTSFSADDII